jgi:hypothetical protein
MRTDHKQTQILHSILQITVTNTALLQNSKAKKLMVDKENMLLLQKNSNELQSH